MPTSDADYYQQHKDDDAEWGEVEGPRRPTRRTRPLRAMVSVRLDERELALIREAADDRQESMSQFIRRSALERAGGATRRFETTSLTTSTAAAEPGTAAVGVPGFTVGSITVTGGTRPSLAGSQDDPHPPPTTSP